MRYFREQKTKADGLIVHSDRGVQYTAKEFRDKLKELGFIQSFSRKGNCYDNSYYESCFSLLKRELGYKVYGSLEEARRDIFEWIEAWYNTQRLHSSLGYKSPVEFEKTMALNMYLGNKTCSFIKIYFVFFFNHSTRGSFPYL